MEFILGWIGGKLLDISLKFLKILNLRKLKFWGVSWDFSGYFLGMFRKEHNPIYITCFQSNAFNNSNHPITKVEGYLISNINNNKISILLDSMPPEETQGIPPKCKFSIRALFRDHSSEQEGIIETKFLNEFSDFTLVVNFDDKTYQKRFSKTRVVKLLEKWRKEIEPKPKPHVAKK